MCLRASVEGRRFVSFVPFVIFVAKDQSR